MIPAVIAAGIACASTPVGDDQFDPNMISLGYTQNSYLTREYNVCAGLRRGETTTTILNQLETEVSVAEASNIVTTARQHLSPNVRNPG